MLVCPGLTPPEFGETIWEKLFDKLKTKLPKLPLSALSPLGPSCMGAQSRVIALESLNTAPPDEVPMKMPVAPPVTSARTKSNINGANNDPPPASWVPQVGQLSVKNPKLRPEGTPVLAVPLGVKLSVAFAPDEESRTRFPPTNIVPAPLVVKTTPACVFTAIPVATANRVNHKVFCIMELSLRKVRKNQH